MPKKDKPAVIAVSTTQTIKDRLKAKATKEGFRSLPSYISKVLFLMDRGDINISLEVK